MVILGIDPGLATMGYGVIEVEGRKAPRDPVWHADDQGRGADASASPLDFLGVNQLMDIYQPDDVAFEELFFSKNVTTGINVSRRGERPWSRSQRARKTCTNIRPCRSNRRSRVGAERTSTRYR